MEDTPRPAGPRLSLVIPAYNEEAVIRQAVAEADAALAGLVDEYEILIIDDGSRDGTAAAVEEESADRPRVRLLRHIVNQGYGRALRTGIEAARFDLVAFTDADCQFHLEDLGLLIPLTAKHPMAVGRRIDRKDPALRRFISWSYNTAVRLLLGTRVKDCDCALKVFRRDALARVLPESRGFFVNTEILARARQLGMPVAEAGVRHRPRAAGVSTVSPRDVPRVLGALLPFWWTRVLFPGGSPTAGLAVGMACLPLVLAAVLLFVRLSCPLQEPVEAAHAEAARQMTAWRPETALIALSYRLFGVSDVSARLAACAVGLLLVVVMYGWARRSAGSRAAAAGTLVLALCAPFLYVARLVTPDGLTALAVVAVWATACRGRPDRSRPTLWAGGSDSRSESATTGGSDLRSESATIGLALLAGLFAGPAAVLLSLGPVLAFGLLDSRAPRPGLKSLLCLAAAILIAFLVNDRTVSLTTSIPLAVWLAAAPAVILVPGFVRFLLRPSVRTASQRPPVLGFWLLCAGTAVILLPWTGLLPVVCPTAMALGCYLGSGRLPRPAVLARRLTRATLAGGLLVTAAAAGTGLLGRGSAVVLGGVMVVALWAAVARARRAASTEWRFAAGTLFVLLLAGAHQLLPSYARSVSLRGQVRTATEDRDPLPVACYPRRWDSVSFYLRRDDVEAYGVAERSALVEALRGRRETLVFVEQGEPLNALLTDLPPGMEFVRRGRQGAVTVGSVRHRLEAPLALYARAGAMMAPESSPVRRGDLRWRSTR